MMSYSLKHGEVPKADFSMLDADDMGGAPERRPAVAYRRLLELIAEDASWVDVDRVRELIEISGLDTEFRDLFSHANSLDISADLVATIVISQLLGGPLGEFLSEKAKSGAASLASRGREAMEALRDMRRHGEKLARATARGAAHDLLHPRWSESLERFARIPELIEHIEDSIRNLLERSAVEECA